MALQVGGVLKIETEPRKTALARPNKKLKLQTRPLVREGARHQQHRNCLGLILKKGEKSVTCPGWVPDTKTDWTTDLRS
jgi:hypothetical protein